MKKLKEFLSRLPESFLFVPTIIILFAGALAIELVTIIERLLHAIQVIALHTRSVRRRRVLLEQVRLFEEMARGIKTEKHQAAIKERVARVRLLLTNSEETSFEARNSAPFE